MKKLLASLVLLLSVFSASPTLADAPWLWLTPASGFGTFVRGIPVPNTRDCSGACNWKTTVNVYEPTAAILAAVAEIPGATGNADDVCSQFNECFANPVTTASQVNWGLLSGYFSELITINTVAANGGLDGCVAAHITGSVGGSGNAVLNVASIASNYYPVTPGQTVVVAGASLGVTILPYGTNGTTGTGGTGTYALSGNGGSVPGGTTIFLEGTAPKAPNTTTSCNLSESSGQDDLEFYLELSDWISGGCVTNTISYCTAVGSVGGSAAKFIIGFSNGGMFVTRLWCENDSRYHGYGVVSGPMPVELNAKGCPAPTPRSYIAWFGGLDPDLGICPPSTCTSSSTNLWLTSPTWQGQNPTFAILNPPATYVAAQYYLCTISSIFGGSPACAGSGAAIPSYPGAGFNAVATRTAVKNGFLQTYCYGGATCPIELNYVEQGGHPPTSDASALGYAVIGPTLKQMSNN